ncbi:hypothetical protein PR202_gn00331 [Eleusine coracana subsp. coracana]|uniref:Uncharacterized protein n=1 Tax=Eleusine coracana subsp. coracana TaxID=191504 RepID=A0AAV5G1A9_ELECO|nr:hypothetical protein PR202_gn00227 [Eleusine coracana subsp. coracana]GJN41012.1 hypothetical protein PR202_gn00331 [Eleusine coracana subsp. coracana]
MDATIIGTDSDDDSEYYERVDEGNNAKGHLQGNERTMACAKNAANDIEQEEGKSSRETKDRWSKDPFATSQEAGPCRINSMKASSLPHTHMS